MKRRSLKLLMGALSVTLMAGLFAGCGNNGNNAGNNTGNTGNGTQQEEKISGEITALGSSALQPLAEQAAKDFMKKYPDAIINVQGGGSGAGINQVAAGTVDIGNSDVPAEAKLKDSALLNELVDHKVAGIGFAVVVNSGVDVDSLTKAQIQDIFEGKVTNWKELGGKDMAINIINRPSSSGTRSSFVETVMDGKKEKEGLGTTQDSSGAVRNALKTTEGGISYLALSYLSEEVRKDIKVLQINGVEATNENISAGSYPFWSYEHMYTKGEATGLAKAYLDYMVSDDNRELVLKLGYIPMGDLK